LLIRALLFGLTMRIARPMNTDMPAFTAFALESYRSPSQAAGDSSTLTLQLAIAPARSLLEPMGGRASANPAPVHCANLLRAAVVPADGTALTITF
jgi:hypothetical protein